MSIPACLFNKRILSRVIAITLGLGTSSIASANQLYISNNSGSLVDPSFRGQVEINNSQITLTPSSGPVQIHSDLNGLNIHFDNAVYVDSFTGSININSIDDVRIAANGQSSSIRKEGDRAVSFSLTEELEIAVDLDGWSSAVSFSGISQVQGGNNSSVIGNNQGSQSSNSVEFSGVFGGDLEIVDLSSAALNSSNSINGTSINAGTSDNFTLSYCSPFSDCRFSTITPAFNLNLVKLWPSGTVSTTSTYDKGSLTETTTFGQVIAVDSTFNVNEGSTLSSRGDGLLLAQQDIILAPSSTQDTHDLLSRNPEGYYLTSTLRVPASATLEAILNDGHNPDKAFFEADIVNLADNSGIKINGSASDYTLPTAATRYVIVEADELNTDQDQLNLSSEGLIEVEFAEASDNQIAVIVKTQDLSELASSFGGTLSTQAAAGGLQSVLAELGNTATGERFYDMALNMRDQGSFDELNPTAENTSGQTIRGADSQSASQIGNLLQGYRGGASGDDTPTASGFWLQGLRSDGEQDNNGSDSGFEVETSGYAVGYDIALPQGFTAGLAISYADSDIKMDSNYDRQNSDGYTTALYGLYQFGDNYYGEAIVSYGQQDNDSQRWVSNGYAEGEFDSDISSLRLAGGKKIWFDEWLLQPRGEFNYSDINIDSYAESNHLATLDMNAQNYQIAEVGIGASIGRDFAIGSTLLRPEIQAMGYHDFQQDGVKITSAFTAGGNNFVTTGEAPDSERYNMKLSLAWLFGSSQTLRASYDYSGSDHYSGSTWLMDYRMDF